MPKSHNQKAKILILEQLLCETDEHRTISMQQIIDVLAGYGICAERKSIYDDMEALRDFGYGISYKRGRNGGYYATSLPEYRQIKKDARVLTEEAKTSEEPSVSEKRTEDSQKGVEETKEKRTEISPEKSTEGKPGMCLEEICNTEKNMKLVYPADRAEEVRAYFEEKGKYKEKSQGHWTASVPRLKGPHFYGWLVSMEGEVHISKPKKAAEEYRKFLKDLIKEYRKL